MFLGFSYPLSEILLGTLRTDATTSHQFIVVEQPQNDNETHSQQLLKILQPEVLLINIQHRLHLCDIVELYACSGCNKKMTVTCYQHCRSKLVQFLPSSLHREVMAEKTLLEKFILMSRIWRSGSCRRTFLCMGVKSNFALAWTSYWSRVDRDLSNHWFLSGHHNAWSDQSAAISAKKKKSR